MFRDVSCSSIGSAGRSSWDWRTFSTRERVISTVALAALGACVVLLVLYLNASASESSLPSDITLIDWDYDWGWHWTDYFG